MKNVTTLKTKPLANLEEALIEQTRNFESVEPVYLQRLAAKMKASEIAEELGYTPSGISAVINGDAKCRKVVELAAQLIYQENFEKSKADKPVCAFITGDLQLMKMVQGMMGIGAGNFVFVEIPK